MSQIESGNMDWIRNGESNQIRTGYKRKYNDVDNNSCNSEITLWQKCSWYGNGARNNRGGKGDYDDIDVDVDVDCRYVSRQDSM